ncbi:MAG: hypothetical protein E6G52_09310, partial [Actinobacteria bacterium]
MSAQTLERPSVPRPGGGAGPRPWVSARAAMARWGLRGTALLYLGLMIVLPTVVVVARGFGSGLTAFRDALTTPGAREAIV